MTRQTRGRRTAFTLVELLVAIAIIVTLTSLAVVMATRSMDQDRTIDGAATVRQVIQIAKARAARDGLPRGVRFVTGLDPTRPEKNNPMWSTEVQYLEAPPLLVLDADPNAPSNVSPSPQLQFVYATGNPPNATIANRECRLVLPGPYDAVGQLMVGTATANTPYTLVIPSLGTAGVPFYAKVVGATPVAPPAGAPYYRLSLWPAPPTTPSPWPDEAMGAETYYATFYFGLYSPPRPLLGEKGIPLPDKICVDLSPTGGGATAPSSPPGQYDASGNPLDYDIVFAPNGSVILGPGAATGQIMLWVRDYTKTPSPLVGSYPGPFDMTVFRKGGEQQIVALKTKSGSLGVFPVMEPQANGMYVSPPPPGQPVQDPYTYARMGATGQ